jgi:integrase
MTEVYLRSRPVKKLQPGQKKPGRSLYLDIYEGWNPNLGRYKRRTENLPGLYLVGDRLQDRETEKRAEELCLARRKELNAGEGDSAQRRKESFVQYMRDVSNTKTGKTKRSWINAANHLAEAFPNGLTFSQVTRKNLETLKRSLLQNLGQASSAAFYLGVVKTAIRQAVDENILSFDMARPVKIKFHHRLRIYLSLDDLKKLQETPCEDEEVKRAFLFSAFSGLRLSDVENLKWASVHLDGGYLEFTQKKTGSPERLPLAAQAQEILAAQGHSGEFVFDLPRRGKLDTMLKLWGKDAGLDKRISFHKARHTFATLAISAGVDIYTLMKLLGHSSVQVTQLYAHLVDEHKQKAVDMMPTLSDVSSTEDRAS